jgi:cytochrome c oxidase subunit 2
MRAVHIEIPRDASLDGHVVDGVLRYLTISTGLAFAALVVILAVTIVRDRARPGRPDGLYVHGDKLRDQALTFAVGLTLFGAVDMVLATRATDALSATFWRYPDGDPSALRVEVTARQWSWTFRTAGPDGRFGTADDVVTLNELHVPVGRPVYFKLRSKDVVHSLYLPNFRTKLDAIPGNTTRMWIQATEPGRYEIGCAQYCGVSHYKMRALLIAERDDDYRVWLARAETDSRLRYDPAAGDEQQAWSWETGR